MRLRLRAGRYSINAIYFSASAQSAAIEQGDFVDIAFVPQVNEFRGERLVQMNVLDIRPACKAACSADTSAYQALVRGTLTREQARQLLPERKTLATVWRYLSTIDGGNLRQTPMCLCRKIVRWSGEPMSLGMLMTCMDIFADVGLLQLQRQHKYISLQLMPRQDKADLSESQTMQRLVAAEES